MTQLGGKVALVTGASRGIGYAIAEALLGRGAALMICGRDAAAAQHAADRLERGTTGGSVRALPCDVRDADACAALVQRTVTEFGRLDILVNNAGIGVFGSVADLAVDDWRAVIATNLDGVFYCSHFALPHLAAVGDSWVINIGSLAGKNAFPGGAAYNASKFGLIGFSEAFMQEVRHLGVRVSYVMPGSVSTGFSQGEADWKIQPEDIGQLVLDLIDMPARTLPSRIEVRPSRPPSK